MTNMVRPPSSRSSGRILVVCSLLLGSGSAFAQMGAPGTGYGGATGPRPTAARKAPAAAATAPAATPAPPPASDPFGSGTQGETPLALPPAESDPAPEAAPVPPPPAPAPARPRAARPPVAPPPVAPPSPEPASQEVAEPFQHHGFGIEALTAGFASGGLGGLLLGYKGNQVMVGGNIGVATATLTDPDYSYLKEDLTAFRIGPGVRVPVARSKDERSELYIHGDLGLIFLSGSTSGGSTTNSASGTLFQLNGGIGARFWISPHIAAGYVVLLKYLSSPSTPSNGVLLPVPAVMGETGWHLDGSFAVTAAF